MERTPSRLRAPNPGESHDTSVLRGEDRLGYTSVPQILSDLSGESFSIPRAVAVTDEEREQMAPKARLFAAFVPLIEAVWRKVADLDRAVQRRESVKLGTRTYDKHPLETSLLENYPRICEERRLPLHWIPAVLSHGYGIPRYIGMLGGAAVDDVNFSPNFRQIETSADGLLANFQTAYPGPEYQDPRNLAPGAFTWASSAIVEAINVQSQMQGSIVCEALYWYLEYCKGELSNFQDVCKVAEGALEAFEKLAQLPLQTFNSLIVPFGEVPPPPPDRDIDKWGLRSSIRDSGYWVMVNRDSLAVEIRVKPCMPVRLPPRQHEDFLRGGCPALFAKTDGGSRVIKDMRALFMRTFREYYPRVLDKLS